MTSGARRSTSLLPWRLWQLDRADQMRGTQRCTACCCDELCRVGHSFQRALGPHRPRAPEAAGC